MSTEVPVINKEYMKALYNDKELLKKEVRDPVRLAEINAFLASPEALGTLADTEPEVAIEEVLPTETLEELNQDDAEKAAADAKAQEEAAKAAQAEADRIAAEKAAEIEKIKAAEKEAADRAQALHAAGITIHKDDKGAITKIVKTYQALDEAGNPIGRPTYLEAKTWEELSVKQQEAHVQATRAFNRLKTQKTTFNQKQPVVPSTMTDEELVQAAEDLKSDDKAKADAADRKIRANSILVEQKKLADEKEVVRQQKVSYEFLRKHISDFNNCEANVKVISGYIADNNLEWTVDNLELALAATESQLAPREVRETSAAVPEADNPPVKVQPEVTPAAPAAVIQPAPAPAALEPVAPAPKVEAANPPTPAARPGVNAGLQPGQMSAPRPVGKPQGLTMKEIYSWPADKLKKERTNPARRAEIDRVIAAYNQSRSAKT